MNTFDIHALAGAYALDAVSDSEREQFEQHMLSCEACSTEVAELRETAARLADGAWSTPPPRLRGAVLDQIHRTRQAPPLPVAERPRTAVPRWRHRLAYALAAGVVAIAGAAVTYDIQQDRLDRQRQVTADIEAQQARMQALLTSKDAVVRSGPVTGGGQVTMVMSPSRNEGVVLLADAPTPGPDQAYQLWLIEGTTPVSAGVLLPGHSSGTRLVTGVLGAQMLGVTLEPAAGSATPTLPVVAQVPMT
jgi:anti-sigma-K factor RskA